MIKILITDDHSILRMGLKIYIQKYFPHSLIEEANDEESLFQKITDTEFQLLILDINMRRMNSFGVVSKILLLYPGTRILIYSMNAEEIFARRFLQAGVMGYLTKNASEEELKIAIGNILNNKRYVSSSVLHSLTENSIHNKPDNPFCSLSCRESEIVEYLLQGNTTSIISRKLNLQPSTVATYKARIFEKLNCKNILDVNMLARIYQETA